ncbi:hypothetical protein [Sphingomonas radiodurans]|uniref:hypothetical protein n=1 Tax=Sphingomonas radiodurans TaxID=2890321 RepID=UPI001E4542F7|nr:hypothetical protein [Sphingomonas radiodurans]WBH16136.1 hypothetical protein LLW23_15200 [Sphingomonas radiodurans]
MIRTSIMLSAALAVAGCSGEPAANEQAAAPQTSQTFASPNLAGGSWSGVFSDPKTSIDKFGRIGLRPGPYEKKGGEWRSEAVPTALTDPSATNPVMAHFTASGDEKALNKVEFRLVEPQMANDQQARDQFDAWMKQALSQLGVTGGDTAVKAIHGEKPLVGKLKAGADYAVVRTTTPTERRLTVTFTEAAPISGATDATTD